MTPTPSVEDLLSNGPALSSNLIAAYTSRGLTAAAARQRLVRRSKRVQALKGLPFSKRAQFLYLKEQFGTKEFYKALIEAVDSSPAYVAAIAGLVSNGGVVPMNDWDIISGSPIRQKAQLSSEEILKRLITVRLVEVEEVYGVGKCITLKQHKTNITSDELRARLIYKQILADTVAEWLIRINFASTGTISVRGSDPAPKFSTFNFDIVGPNYSLVARKRNPVQPGFTVVNIAGSGEVDKNSILPFLRKVKLLSHLPKVSRFLPILVADRFTIDALYICRAAGITPITPTTLFGQQAANALAELLGVLRSVASLSKSDPEKLAKLLDVLTSLGGRHGQLKGSFFELISAHIVRASSPGTVEVGIKLTTDQKTAEVDVRDTRGNEIIFYECKGKQSTNLVSAEDIDIWLSKKVPIMVSATRAVTELSNRKIRFEYWTTGSFEPEAIAKLEKLSRQTLKYSLGWADGAEIRRRAKEHSSLKAIVTMLDTHYLKISSD